MAYRLSKGATRAVNNADHPFYPDVSSLESWSLLHYGQRPVGSANYKRHGLLQLRFILHMEAATAPLRAIWID